MNNYARHDDSQHTLTERDSGCVKICQPQSLEAESDTIQRIQGSVGEAICLRAWREKYEQDLVEKIPASWPDDNRWLDDVGYLVEDRKLDSALDVVVEKFDGWFAAQQFEVADAALRAIDVGKLATDLVIGVLSITLCAREHLPSRSTFVRRARKELSNREPSRVDRLLQGLE